MWKQKQVLLKQKQQKLYDIRKESLKIKMGIYV